MAVAIEKLKAELAVLTERERADLAHFLLESLQDAGVDTDADVEAAWDIELARRADEIEAQHSRGQAGQPSIRRVAQKYS